MKIKWVKDGDGWWELRLYPVGGKRAKCYFVMGYVEASHLNDGWWAYATHGEPVLRHSYELGLSFSTFKHLEPLTAAKQAVVDWWGLTL